MNSRIDDIVNKRSLIQTLGSGGVGKTTLSVVLGMAAAKTGKKTLVITIDPSRRLMDTLKIKTEQEIHYVREFNFDAMMPNIKRCWELVLSKYASERDYQRIIKNRFNKYLKDYFPNFDEYIASELVYYMLNVMDYDIIIVDSPPSTYAVSYLEASNRVVDVLSNDFILSLIPYINLSNSPLKYIMKKEVFILKNIAKFTGMDMLMNLLNFINDLTPLLHGFKQRADFIRRYYGSERTGFVLVSLPNNISLNNTRYLLRYLKKASYNIDGIFINRLCSLCGRTEDCHLNKISIKNLENIIENINDIRLQQIIRNYFAPSLRSHLEALNTIKNFIRDIDSNIDIFAVPEMIGYIKSRKEIVDIYYGIKELGRI